MQLYSLLVSYRNYWQTGEGENKLDHYDYPDVWTSYAKDALSCIFLYMAIALAVILLAVGIFVRMKREEQLRRYTVTAVAIACGFAVTVIVAMLSLEFLDMQEKGYVTDLLLWPAVALGCTLVAGIAAAYIASLFSPKASRIVRIAALSLIGAALVAVLVCIGVYFSGSIQGDGYYDGLVNDAGATASVNQIVLYVSAAVLLAAIVGLAFLFGRGDAKGFDSKSISYASICIAMSFALSYLRIFHLPQGGSVTIASLLPLMIYSYMFGVKKGVFAGFVYGLLQAVQDPWIIHPAQFLLDYPVAFSAIGLAGMFSKTKALSKAPQAQFALGAVAASVLRFASHLLSGVFAFSAYAVEENMNAWYYSLGYNSFVFADIAIAIAVGVLVFSSKSFMKQVKKFTASAKNTPAMSGDEAQNAPEEAPVSEMAAAQKEAPMSEDASPKEVQ